MIFKLGNYSMNTKTQSIFLFSLDEKPTNTLKDLKPNSTQKMKVKMKKSFGRNSFVREWRMN